MRHWEGDGFTESLVADYSNVSCSGDDDDDDDDDDIHAHSMRE
jgi:hypothetical protein